MKLSSLRRLTTLFSLLLITQAYALPLDESALTVPAGQWQTAVPASTSGNAGSVKLAVNEQGDAIAVWGEHTGDDSQLYANYYVNNTWQTPEPIETLSGNAYLRALTINADGSAVVTWQNKNTNNQYELYTSQYNPGSGWTTPEQIADSSARHPVTASSDNGHTIVAWAVIENNAYQVYARLHHASTGWTAPVAIPGLNNEHTYKFRNILNVDINSQGEAVITWLKNRITNPGARRPRYAYDAYASRYTNNTWQTAEALESFDPTTAASSEGGVAVGIDENSNIITTWAQYDSNNQFQLYTNRYESTTGWQGATSLHTSSQRSLSPELTINNDGEAITVWREEDQTVLAKNYSPDNGWQAAVILDDATSAYINRLGEMTINTDGQAAVIWRRQPDSSVLLYDIHVNRYDGTTWQGAETLEDSTDNGLTPDIGITDKNEILAVWLQQATDQSDIQSRHFQIGEAYYEVQQGDTFNSIALLLYGSETVADELQSALNNPVLTAGNELSGLPQELNNTNNAPVANNDDATTSQNQSVIINVLNNDSDPDNDTIFIQDATAPANGSITVANNNLSLTYIPNSDYTGTDTFSYTINDGKFATSTATVNLTISSNSTDSDGDGIPDISDQCPGTLNAFPVDGNGCADNQLDNDSDGVANLNDQCPATLFGATVDANGCSTAQLDSDNDGISNDIDQCDNTPANEAADANGCSPSQLDSDNDGVNDDLDQCPGTDAGVNVDNTGCPSGTDTTAPELTITNPQANELVYIGFPSLKLDYSDQGSGIDFDSISFTLNNQTFEPVCTYTEVSVTCSPFTALPDGDNTLQVSISDLDGNSTTQQVSFSVDVQPVAVTITSPTDLTITGENSVTVTGEVEANISSVTINGEVALVNGNTFTADVELRQGTHMIVAVAERLNGKTGSDTVEVTYDAIAPHISIDYPRDGFTSVNDTVAVTGKVNDIVSGGTNATVTVNGIQASVRGGEYMVTDIPLVRGNNIIETIAVDSVGNESRTSITINYRQPTGARMTVLSGNGQTGEVSAELSEPLTVQVKDRNGNPVAGRAVEFNVTRNNGLLRQNTAASEYTRKVQVITNGSGIASALFKLGDVAAEGNNRVIATSVGIEGEVEFCAAGLSALPSRIVMDEGDNQRGLAGHPLPMPFKALVVDDMGNPVPDIPVTFTVVRGNGTIDGEGVVTRITGADGKARVNLTLGPEDGINSQQVQAVFPGQDSLPALFTATALAAKNPVDTQFKGVLFDSAHTPIPNAVVSIPEGNVSTTTDDEGQFLLSGVPVGTIHLKIDPSGTTRPETFPPMEFETVTIAGQVNKLGMPIVIPPLQLASSKVVGGDQDVILTMPGIEGFALKVFANSATFPNGEKTGQLTVSQVHMDKVPMPPPNGLIFSAPTWTIQPHGVHFDPPAQITIPNDGKKPGSIIDIYQFDHAINTFVNIGKGTVDEEGFAITSDPGFGVVSAGWGGGGGGPPPSGGGGGPCPSCNSNPPNPTPPPPNQCNFSNVALSFDANGRKDRLLVGKTGGGAPVTFRALAFDSNCDFQYEIDFGDGVTTDRTFITYTYEESGTYTANVTVTCSDCGSNSLTKNIQIDVVEVTDIKIRVGNQTDFRDFRANEKILLGKEAAFQAQLNNSTTLLPDNFMWQGSYGVTGDTMEVSHTYSGNIASDDSDVKEVYTNIGPDERKNILVCGYVLGIHSNVEPTADLIDGHAWISVENHITGVNTRFGLWPDGHEDTVNNGDGTDVRINLEAEKGRYNRYYLICPSQLQALVNFINTTEAWGYLNTCANWAEDAVSAAVNETVDASDLLIFGTPRKLSESIIELETSEPTQENIPYDGGEEATSSSSGSSSFNGTSFLPDFLSTGP